MTNMVFIGRQERDGSISMDDVCDHICDRSSQILYPCGRMFRQYWVIRSSSSVPPTTQLKSVPVATMDGIADRQSLAPKLVVDRLHDLTQCKDCGYLGPYDA
jgi:hypothetical protein